MMDFMAGNNKRNSRQGKRYISEMTLKFHFSLGKPCIQQKGTFPYGLIFVPNAFQGSIDMGQMGNVKILVKSKHGLRILACDFQYTGLKHALCVNYMQQDLLNGPFSGCVSIIQPV